MSDETARKSVPHAYIGKSKRTSKPKIIETARLSENNTDPKTVASVEYQKKQCLKDTKNSVCAKDGDESDDGVNPLRTAFDKIKDHYDSLPLTKLYDLMISRGICPNEDMRLTQIRSELEERYKDRRITDIVLNYKYFKKITEPVRYFMIKMIENNLAITDVDDWIRCMSIYHDAIKEITGEELIVSLTSTDGQKLRLGNVKLNFSMNEHFHLVSYLMALEILGFKRLHETIGLKQKPSSEWTPENPLMGVGALAVMGQLMYNGYNTLSPSERFSAIKKSVSDLTGGLNIETDSNNSALFERKSEYLKALLSWVTENQINDETTWDVDEIIKYYLECLNFQVNAETLSIIGAALANGGTCVTNGRKVFCCECVEHLIGLLSCSSKKPGVPIMSSSSGTIIVIVPTLFGLVVHSKNYQASCYFISALLRHYALNPYERVFLNINESNKNMCPCIESALFLTARTGDILTLASMLYYEVALFARDYMCRTILHIAAARGHYKYVRFLINYCPQLATATDIMGRTPLDDANDMNEKGIVALLQGVTTIRKRKKSSNSSLSSSTTNNSNKSNSC